jgi:hypothetical protein
VQHETWSDSGGRCIPHVIREDRLHMSTLSTLSTLSTMECGWCAECRDTSRVWTLWSGSGGRAGGRASVGAHQANTRMCMQAHARMNTHARTRLEAQYTQLAKARARAHTHRHTRACTRPRCYARGSGEWDTASNQDELLLTPGTMRRRLLMHQGRLILRQVRANPTRFAVLHRADATPWANVQRAT